MTRMTNWQWMGLCAAVLLAAGCGGAGGGADGTPLDILATAPADGDVNVPETSMVTVDFAADLDPASIGTDALTVETAMGPVEGTVTYKAADRRLVFTPDDALALSAPHLARVPAGIRDTEGNTATASYVFTFETREAQADLPRPLELLGDPVYTYGFEVSSAGQGALVRVEYGATTRTLRVHHFDTTDGFTTLVPLRTVTNLNIDGRGFALAENGDMAVAWSEWDGDQYDAYVRRFRAATRTWGPVVVLEEDPGQSSHGLTVAVTNGGDVLVNWYQQVDSSSDADLWAKTYTPTTGWTASAEVDGGAGDVLPGQFAVNGARRAVLVFAQRNASGYYDAYARRWAPGTGFEAVEPIETYADETTFPGNPVMDDEGRITVFLTRRETLSTAGGRETLWAVTYEDGLGWHDHHPLQIETGDVSGPRVAMDASGNVTAGWGFYSNPYSSYHVARYVAGEGWEPSIEISPERSGGLKYAKHDVVAGENGRATAFWSQSNPDGSGGALLGSEYRPGLGWSPYRLVRLVDGAEALRAEVEPSGAALLYWLDDDPLQTDAHRFTLLRVRPGVEADAVPFAEFTPGEYMGATRVALDGQGRGAAVWMQAPVGSDVYSAMASETR